ncbi:DUF1801 domain-containing protein [Flavobacterium sp.]|uniref:DUF1801 domain-containing protein n=1 Tax=Flavobacterium sp. TaxID=239 RepID=UPI00286AA361|nr:DUF1801 domain-containing protein [Flavobacterium sp.]
MKPAEVYILNQPENYRNILFHIIDVVQNTILDVTLEYKWTVPYFYYKKKPLCYLNANHKHGFVDVGFAKGFELKNNLDYLIADNGRNTIKSLRYFSLEQIDNAILISVLEETKSLY